MKAEYLPKEQYKSILRKMQPGNALALKVALRSGLRIDDVLSRTPDELVGNKLFFTAKKTGKPGEIILPRSLADALRKNANSRWLFPSPYRGGVKHLTRQAVFLDMQKSAVRCTADMPHVSPHSTRKTFAVELRKTKGFEAVQTALQHTDLATTMIYALSDYNNYKREVNQIDCEALACQVAERVAKMLLPEVRNLLVDFASTVAQESFTDS